MRDLDDLVRRAADRRRPTAERHEAFGELVAGFQDMAFACAFSVLGDFCLAEDAAQEAFITAWQRLAQLRSPEAFPGWLRRVVLTQCNRLTRGKRLKIMPLETDTDAPSTAPDPQSVAEGLEMQWRVLAAIRALPERERQVVTLFYVDGYTQADIGEFLQLPVSTVNKRLYTASSLLLRMSEKSLTWTRACAD